MTATDWAAVRGQMILDPEVVQLNTGSFGAVSKRVYEAADAFRRRTAASPTDFFIRQSAPLLWAARCRLAEFLGTDPTRLVFSANVSSAINVVASGLRLAAPGEVLMTDREYPAMRWCWERAARAQGLGVRTFALPHMPDDPGEYVAALEEAIAPRTRLVFFSHVLAPTGAVLPAAEMCAAIRRRGAVSVVDGAHAPAMIPLEVDGVGADFYAGNCHKWLMAPTGAGFLAVGPANHDRLRPLQVSWGWHPDRSRPDEPDEFGSTPRLKHLEFEGSRDLSAWLSVPEAIDFQAEIGWDSVRGRVAELAAYTRERVGAAGLELATPPGERMHGSMTAFDLPAGLDPMGFRRRLWERKIEVNITERPGSHMLRVSTAFFNTEGDIDRLAEALPAALAG